MRYFGHGTLIRTALATTLLAGCGTGTGNVPPDSKDRASTAGNADTTAEETTTSIPPDGQAAHDPPAQPPQKQAGLFFPQIPEPTSGSPDALGSGRLFVKSGCIYMGSRRHADVVVWPYGYSLNRKSGEIAVLNEDGNVVALVGEEVRMGSGELTQGEAGPTSKVARQQFAEKRGELGVPG